MKSINSEKSSTEPSLSLTRVNEILLKAGSLVSSTPGLRFGQAIISELKSSEYTHPWPELFYEEDANKAYDIFIKAAVGD